MSGIAIKAKKEERPNFAKRTNRTGIPLQLKERMEQNTGVSFDDVRVHYNSALPAKLDALAYTKGNQVEIGPGQERQADEIGAGKKGRFCFQENVCL